jgi:hypothetical protein
MREKKRKKNQSVTNQTTSTNTTPYERENDNAFNDTVKGYFWMLGSAG